jgi:hypothetical protein
MLEIPVTNAGNTAMPVDVGQIRFNFLPYTGSVYPSGFFPDSKAGLKSPSRRRSTRRKARRPASASASPTTS